MTIFVLFVLAYPGCPGLPSAYPFPAIQSWLPRRGSSSLVGLSRLSCTGCPGPALLSCLSCYGFLSQFPVPLVLSLQSRSCCHFQAILSSLSCPGWHIRAILPRTSWPCAMAVLKRLSTYGTFIQSLMSCSCFHVPAILSSFLSCPVLIVLSGCPAILSPALLSLVCCPWCIVLAVLSLLYNPCCTVPAALSLLSCSDYPFYLP